MDRPNEIYDDRVCKYCINLPIPMVERLKKISRKEGVYHLSIYIRQILMDHLDRYNSISYSMIRDNEVTSRENPYAQPPPFKHEGFQNNLKKNPFKLVWWRYMKERTMPRPNPNQPELF